MQKSTTIILFLLFAIVTQSISQEICDNAIDDDADGLIDLNDEDCICNTIVPSSLIPNPSFEEMTCCPNANEMLNCAIGWEQASAATSDYVHTCEGYLGNVGIPAIAPLPFADGEGGAGFRDGQQQVGPNYKEYIGACLTESMEVGVTYRLDFFVGFQDNVPGSMSFDMAVFASSECSDLPFGGNNFDIGCPTNAVGYVELGEQFVSGSNEWVNVVFEFVADQAYEVIVLGPSCEANSNYLQNPYFYVDRLAFEKSTEFGGPFESVTGSICENDLILTVTEEPGLTYQWYQDGIAMIGETNPSLLLTSIDNTEGTYLVVITGPDGCGLSQEYELLIPPYYAPLVVNVCNPEYYILGTDTLTESGYYENIFAASDGCDSIVQLTLEVNEATFADVADSFCEGEAYTEHGLDTYEEGTYQVNLTNTAGCDSIVTLVLTSDAGLGVQLPRDTSLLLGDEIDLSPVFYDPDYTTFVWMDDAGTVISNELMVVMYQPTSPTIMFLETLNDFGCSALDSMFINVTALYDFYVPNAFSPDGNGINDFFRFYPSSAVAKIHSFSIFDRWGGLAFRDSAIDDAVTYIGWDGKVNGEKSQVGVYCYMIEVLFLDGTEKVFAGDVTLLR